MTDATSLPADLLAAIEASETLAMGIIRVAQDEQLGALAAAVVGFARAHRRIVAEILPQIEILESCAEGEWGTHETTADDLLDLVAGCYGLGAADPQKVFDSEGDQT